MQKAWTMVLLIAVAATADIVSAQSASARPLVEALPTAATTTTPAPTVTPAVVANPTASKCPSGYKLSWNDEFDDLNSLSKWNYELYNGCQYGICGWGNNELEWYTSRADNANVALGKLVITAKTATAAERVGCCDGGACKNNQCQYTSARLRTYGKFSTKPSWDAGNKVIRISARMKLPVGKGLWPSLWMLPDTKNTSCSGCGFYGAWPASGAITLGQAVNEMKNVTGGIAYGSPYPKGVFSTFVKKIDPYDYHEYTLEWSRRSMKWLIDGSTVHTAKSSEGGTVPGGWFSTGAGGSPDKPFDSPFHIIVNLAVGGNPTGASNSQVKDTLKTPKSLALDYIRVCTK